MALDPDILCFDGPSAGLDPLSSRRQDDVILGLRESLGATVVVVTHALASILTLGDHGVFLDPETKTMLAGGESHNPAGYLPRAEDARLPPAGGSRHHHSGMRRDPASYGRAGERNKEAWEVESIRP
jgi:energy-coupling factor transporter ATP-binding protein EcfA2